MTPDPTPLNSVQPSEHGSALAGALLWGIPAALLAALVQGVVALRFDVGVLYPAIGHLIGSLVHIKSPGLQERRRQTVAVLLTYLAVALSPSIPFGHAVGFDPTRMRDSAVGLVLTFVPLMAKSGLVGLLNVGLLLLSLRQAWIRSGRAVPTKQTA